MKYKSILKLQQKQKQNCATLSAILHKHLFKINNGVDCIWRLLVACAIANILPAFYHRYQTCSYTKI